MLSPSLFRMLKTVILFHWAMLFLGYILVVYIVLRALFNLPSISIDLYDREDALESAYMLIAVMFSVLIPFIIIRILKRQGEPKAIILISQKLVALISFLWFLWMLLIEKEPLYGLYPALASCILIFLGATSFGYSKDSV